MKNCIYKESLGGGHGINRNVSREKILPTAVPPYGGVTRNHPGKHVEKHTNVGPPKRRTGTINV